ncbi:MAG: response regulator transcription factor [Candidatus Omnitrophica bacterium]|nr:response regulator transcription factor [Candidatus Omnitrophota bacterium]
MAKKILLIDDEREFTEMIKMRLEALGYDVAAVNEGKLGFEMAKKILPDIILLDLVMPEKNGLLVLSELKGNPYTEVIPVIMLTAKTEEEYQMDAGSLGAVNYLSKPVKMEELEAAIKKLL